MGCYGSRYIPALKFALYYYSRCCFSGDKTMDKIEANDCCDLGVKGSCVTCDYSTFCNGKWSHGTEQTIPLQC